MSMGLVMFFGVVGLNIFSVVWGLVKERTFYIVSFINLLMWAILLPIVMSYKP